MTYAEATVAPASLTATQLVRAVASRTGFVRVYDPTLGGTVAASSANLPSVSAVTIHSQHDDAAPWYSDPSDSNAAKVGEIVVQLTPSAADVVNASSVQTFAVDASAVIVVATG